MKQTIETLLLSAIETLRQTGEFNLDATPSFVVERSRDSQHGDFASNLAMLLAKSARTAPRLLAEKIVAALPKHDAVTKVEIAGAGFINFFIDPNSRYQVIEQITNQGNAYGLSQIACHRKVQIEFVSANPTGPLHVGHGRGAAYGSVLANLLKAAGFDVQREYYVNDAGRQMDILATSVWLRYLEVCGEVITFPSNGYRGDYVRTIATQLHQKVANDYHHTVNLVFDGIVPDEPQGGDKEEHIDALIARSKHLLGATQYRDVFDIGLHVILDDIKQDLLEFGVSFDQWFSERQLMENGSVDKALQRLRDRGHLYEKNGAIWFASSQLGDEKDRVVIRENGLYTYFASDIAYHFNKLERGFDQIIDIWGADHHGYIPRVRAAIEALGGDDSKLKVLLVQFATLYRGEEKIQMSTRSGEFVTLRQLRDEVGRDAARFFYVMRRSDQHIDFDLKLATSTSNENPVFYVQYAHARICSVLRQLDEKSLSRDINQGMANLSKLRESHELELLATLSRYPETLQRAALQYEPHQVIQYLRELAHEFHTYYNAHPFLVEESELRNARLNLISAVKQVLANGLDLLAIHAPEMM